MKRIFIIEDDPALLQTLVSYLEAEDFEVESAQDGGLGCRMALGEKFDLIVLDHGLPTMNGLEICRCLRDNGISTPIIMLTGKKKEDIDKIIGLELGADDYLIKPASPRELLARIHAVLRRTGASAFPARGLSSSVTRTYVMPSQPQIMARGTVYAGRYEIIEELGKGGMGRVYRALDTKVDEEVALKILNPEVAAEASLIERFSNELRLARKITHKNVCRMHDIHEDQGAQFITMEYVPGEDLKSFIRRSKQLAAKTAISIAKQVCQGLAEAHRLGVVHRDLKPQNIMIDREGNARIMDFGIARSVKAKGITDEGTVIGTPEYMSPEQVEGKDVDGRSDIYSLGAVLFEMVTGRVPFEGKTALEIALKHKTEPPPDTRVLSPQIPESLNQIILRCLAKDRAARYQTVEEILTALLKVEESGASPGMTS
jgi:CheY-like chemotaxis protein/predicted Ser/Thr protein kinase